MRIAAIGECMVEFSRAGEARDTAQPPSPGAGGEDLWRRSFAGDVFNTAVYLARRAEGAAEVAFLSALGEDELSGEMVEAWAAEGLDVEAVRRLPGLQPGLYTIRTDERGERSFLYWRKDSAARSMLKERPGNSARKLIEAAKTADWLYLSGITLAILDDADRGVLLQLLQERRAQGRTNAFDPNHRPALWASAEAARNALSEAARHATLALPTFDDERALFGDESPKRTIERYLDLGCDEVAVKNGAEPCTVRAPEGGFTLMPVIVQNPVDTTGAGDSFNAGYLAARAQGLRAEEAAEAGNRLAAVVVQHRGAIIPRAAMPA